MKNRIIFNLQCLWPMPDGSQMDLWEAIKSGKKTIEYRDCTRFWVIRLCGPNIRIYGPQDLTEYLIVKKSWFVVGYPKGCLPRLEADIIGLECNEAMQLEIKFTNVKEVTQNSQIELALDGGKQIERNIG